MWIVRLALRRPYTFVVASMLVAILGIGVGFFWMSTDIFPVVDIPVIAVAFNYTGMSPQDMNDRIIGPFERIVTTTVNDVEHTETQSLYGIGICKIYFHTNAKIENANAQVTAIAQTAIRQMPQGTQPPLITEYNASSVPILQLLIHSKTLPEQALFDLGVNRLRPQLVTISGVQIPYPYGGKQRQLMVDIDPEKMFALGVSPLEVSSAINAEDIVLPAGTEKIGTHEYQVQLNSNESAIDKLNALPIKTVNGATVYVKDVANVRDGFQVQTSDVHSDGKGAVLLSILKSGNASTLDVVSDVLKKLPQIEATLPKELQITPMFDQSIFVRASVVGVIKEASIAAGLTALMILLFLGSWRSTLIVMISIPLSIMVSIIILFFLGYTLNVMTLGGMALAVGILVDDATVEIENIHRNLHQRKRLVKAILDGASQIAVPAFVSTLCICIVFVPVVFISGAAKYLFTPLAMAVVFAMLTSYLLSRTLVPTMVHYLLAAEVEMYGGVLDESDPHAVHARHVQEAREKLAHGEQVSYEDEPATMKLKEFFAKPVVWMAIAAGVALLAILVFVIGATSFGEHFGFLHTGLVFLGGAIKERWLGLSQLLLGLLAVGCIIWIIARLNLVWRVHYAFNDVFEKFRRMYGGLLDWALDHRGIIVTAFSILVVGSCFLMLIIGQDFFPKVDAGQLRLHVRTPPGTRIEQTAQDFAEAEKAIKKIIPPKDLEAVLDNIGIPNSTINLSLSDGSLMSPADGEILVSLKQGHAPTAMYQREMRQQLPKLFPNMKFFFAPADIITQVLNFGLQAPIDIQIAGPPMNDRADRQLAEALQAQTRTVPGVVDVRLRQVPITPDLRVNVDRTMANEIGLSQTDVASDLLVSLSSNSQTAPNYWLSPDTDVQYSILVQTPQYRMDTINDLENTPIAVANASSTYANTQLLSNLAATVRSSTPTNITHYNIFQSYDVLADVAGTDLKSAADQINKIVAQATGKAARGTRINVLGQVQSMHDSFTGLGLGLIFSILLVYLLMVINFQSWIDPLIILMALPGALSGILWMLWATQTNISVPALMGAIMSIGVATANSILMITFANDQREAGMNARQAALAAGLTRLRPVLMTALAMIIGMLPMSLGLGEGGEQNAPLGRAVIGGLAMATFATLFFVPVMYSLLRQKPPVTQVEEELR
jgi:multidrug efflux pump subunit AcrB